MRILLLDSSAEFPANPLFAEALEKMAKAGRHESHFLDEAVSLPSPGTNLVRRLIWRGVRRAAAVGAFNRRIIAAADAFLPDFAIIVKGAHVSTETLGLLRTRGVVLVNFATDDPFSAVYASTPSLRAAIPFYDLYCSTKKAIIRDVQGAGGRLVEYVPFGYKADVHFPEPPANPDERRRFESDVLFIGGADMDRVPIFTSLIKALPEIRLHLYGGYWRRYRALRPYARGIVVGRDYRLAMAGTKIALNLVRRSNRDGHVMRSFEVPACRAFMLAERTSEHAELLDEDKEMVCFGSTEEMIDKVRFYLSRAELRRQVADAGYARIVGGKNTYGDRLETILRMVTPLIEGVRGSDPRA